MFDLNNYFKILASNKEIYLKIKVLPNAKENSFLEYLADDVLKISLKAKAEDNKANLELIKFLAQEFKVLKNEIKIISGKSARIKLVKIKKD